jgi:hypothetical protein
MVALAKDPSTSAVLRCLWRCLKNKSVVEGEGAPGSVSSRSKRCQGRTRDALVGRRARLPFQGCMIHDDTLLLPQSILYLMNNFSKHGRHQRLRMQRYSVGSIVVVELHVLAASKEALRASGSNVSPFEHRGRSLHQQL